MNDDFKNARQGEWLTWLGQPMLYDGGLCVNRSVEEHTESDKHSNVKLEV